MARPDPQRLAATIASLTGLSAAEAVVRHTGELTRSASLVPRLLAHMDALLTPRRTATVAGLLDRVHAALSRQRAEPVEALLDRLATLLSPERTRALSALADQTPRLVKALQSDRLPSESDRAVQAEQRSGRHHCQVTRVSEGSATRCSCVQRGWGRQPRQSQVQEGGEEVRARRAQRQGCVRLSRARGLPLRRRR